MNAPIGIFDSGLGGLSVVAPIRALLPNESLVYIADSAHCPYGEKSTRYLQDRAILISDFLVRQGCKAIVVACNTATVATVNMLRELHAVPVIGLEPAVKPAAAATRTGVIGVLATSATLQSEQYAQLLERYAANLKVLSTACPGWVEAVEQGKLDHPETSAMVERDVRPLLAGGVDTLVLGCTHYLFLRSQIERVAGAVVNILDTGLPVARQLHRRLSEASLLAWNNVPRHRFLTSSKTPLQASFVGRVWPEISIVENFPA